MDIYEYFNSRDLAEHCRGRRFTAWETAYMIWQSDHHSLPQKITAWERLMAETPEECLCRFLEQYIGRLQQFLEDFQQGDGVYSYEKLGSLEESPLFSAYAPCLESALKAVTDGTTVFRIRKRPICHRVAEQTSAPALFLNRDGQPMDLFVAPYYGQEDLLVEPFGFYGMFLALPTPFEKGDLVTATDIWGRRIGPMVVAQLPEAEGSDYTDMGAVLWYLDAGERLRTVTDCSYLSLEHYREQPDKPILLVLRDYCKGQLSLEQLLHSYAASQLEAAWKTATPKP